MPPKMCDAVKQLVIPDDADIFTIKDIKQNPAKKELYSVSGEIVAVSICHFGYNSV